MVQVAMGHQACRCSDWLTQPPPDADRPSALAKIARSFRSRGTPSCSGTTTRSKSSGKVESLVGQDARANRGLPTGLSRPGWAVVVHSPRPDTHRPATRDGRIVSGMSQTPDSTDKETPAPGSFESLMDQMRLALEDPANAMEKNKTRARVVRFHLASALFHKATAFPVGKHSRILVDPKFPSTLKALTSRTPDGDNMLAWGRILSPGDVFVDVGANAGLYSVMAADMGARVVSVEPLRNAGRRSPQTGP